MKYKTIINPNDFYFVSSSITEHWPLFHCSIPDLSTARKLFDWGNPSIKIVLDSLKWFRDQKLIKLFAFCLMPTHIHLLLKLRNESLTINKILFRFHKYTGRKIIEELNRYDRSESLETLQKNSRKKNDRGYLVWEDCLVRNLYNERAIISDFNYLHQNPCAKKWNLVTDPADYPYSSACFYFKGEMPLIEIDDLFKFD